MIVEFERCSIEIGYIGTPEEIRRQWLLEFIPVVVDLATEIGRILLEWLNRAAKAVRELNW